MVSRINVPWNDPTQTEEKQFIKAMERAEIEFLCQMQNQFSHYYRIQPQYLAYLKNQEKERMQQTNSKCKFIIWVN